jgi:hypothetical protein
MSELPLYKDQVLKAEQYKDLLREAEQHRMIKAVTQSEPKRARGADVSRLEALVTLARRIPSLGPIGTART